MRDHRDERNMDAVLAAMAGQIGEGLPAATHGEGLPARRWRARRWWTLGPLAAAAVVAALILARGGGIDESHGPVTSAGAPRAPSMMAEMDVEADRPFVVFPTNNPDIAVVWLLNAKESD